MLIISISICLLLAISSIANAQKIQKAKENTELYPIFKLDELAPFRPGKSTNEIPKKYLPGEKVELSKALKITKYNLTHNAYSFPIWIQHYNGMIIDNYARLPSYFLHDTFHQSLINRFGKQKSYILLDSSAIYGWEDESLKRVYSAGCTITCFPIYYSEQTKSLSNIPTTYKPLARHFLDSVAEN